jgi:aquaporin Z
MAAAGRLPMNQLGWYVGAQFAGGLLGALLVALIASQAAGKVEFKQVALAVSNGYGDHSMGGYKLIGALLAELLFTFVFMLVILGATAKKATPAMAGLAIGLCLALIHICIPSPAPR